MLFTNPQVSGGFFSTASSVSKSQPVIRRFAAEAADVGDAAEVGVFYAQFSGEDGFGHSGHTQYVHTVAAVTLVLRRGSASAVLASSRKRLGCIKAFGAVARVRRFFRAVRRCRGGENRCVRPVLPVLQKKVSLRPYV